MEKNKEIILLKVPKGSMDIVANDNLTKKLGMIFEHKCLGVKATEVAKKYGYSILLPINFCIILQKLNCNTMLSADFP